MVALKSLDYSPFSLKTQEGRREGLILRFVSAEGLESFSEASPLPHYSKETLQDAQRQLQWIKKSPSISLSLYPSVRFALDAGIYALAHPSFPRREITAYFAGSENEILTKAEKLKETPPKCLKIKLGKFSLKQALYITEQMRNVFPFSRFRADFNRMWPLDNAIAFGKSFPVGFFEYIEEPAPRLELLESFYDATGHPTALDETLREISFKELPVMRGVAAVILRPTLQGGIADLSNLIKGASEKNWACTLTSSYESSVGLRCIELFAHALNITTPLGIDTLDFFTEEHENLPYHMARQKNASGSGYHHN